PLLGPDAPVLLVVLLGPLLGALAVAGLQRLPRPGSLREGDHLLLAIAGALLLWPLAAAPTAPIVAAALLTWALPSIVALWRAAAPPGPPAPGGKHRGGRRPAGAPRRGVSRGEGAGNGFRPTGIGEAGGGRALVAGVALGGFV